MTSIFQKLLQLIKQMMIYEPPEMEKPFVLKEAPPVEQELPVRRGDSLAAMQKQFKGLLAYARDLLGAMEKAQSALGEGKSGELENLKEKLRLLERRKSELGPIRLAFDAASKPVDRIVGGSLAENEELLRELYNLPDNKDVLMRKFNLPGKLAVKAMLVYIDGMVDKNSIHSSILLPLMTWADEDEVQRAGKDLEQIILNRLIPNIEAKPITDFADIVDAVNTGDAVLFIDGVSRAVILSTKGYPQRSVGKPTIEQSVRGIQAAFSESLRVNTGLIRSIMPATELVTEIMAVGDRVPLKCAIMYLKSVANPELVSEIKRRISNISTDYVTDIGILEQFIEDHPWIPFPQMLSTERPDRATTAIAEGRIVLLLEGSPFAHIVPVSFFTFFHSSEDFSLKLPAGTFMRMLRMFSAIIAVTLPSLYIAINYYHQEALPTELALVVAGARETVPFPAIFEIVLMEVAFELIREAGLRIPGIMGSTIGIVGALILGQAAVAANIVSPIMVIIIAITGLASFSIPDYRMAFGFRLTRFVFLAFSTTLGLVGLAFALVLFANTLCGMKSFGMPYLAPIAPKTRAGPDVVMRGPVFEQERGPDELNTQDETRQPKVSRKWLYEKARGKK